MIVKILFFASARESCGTSSTEINVEGNSSLKELICLLSEKFPNLNVVKYRYAVAVNKKYIRGDVILQPGDEVAILPPISGG